MNALINTPPLDVYEQMALDDVLVRLYAGESILRFYNWKPGVAVTFGYAQFINEVRKELTACQFQGEICRRPTGGGLVYHQDDLTFSLIFSSQDKPTEIYKKLHGDVHAAFVLNGVSAHIFNQKLPAAAYAPSHNHSASACFVNPVENDLLLSNGQKMLGGAIRRFGTVILYQGSLQIPNVRDNNACKQAIIQGVRSFLGTDLKIRTVQEEWMSQARQLVQVQYRTQLWTEKF